MARNIPSTVDILASSAVSLPVIFVSILEPAAFNFYRDFSVSFYDSQSYKRFDTTDEPKRRRRGLVGSLESVSTLF